MLIFLVTKCACAIFYAFSKSACNSDCVDDEDYGDKHDMDGEVSEDDNKYGLRNMPIIAL